MLLPYVSTRHDVALSVASVASANTAVSAAVLVSDIPCCSNLQKKNVGIVPKVTLRSLDSRFFAIYCSLTQLSFDATQSEPLKKP
jgi:hypothetical protein